MQSHRWLKIAVCGFSFFLKNEFVRYLYATHFFQRISLVFLHYLYCIIVNIIHLAFTKKISSLSVISSDVSELILILYLHGIILILYPPPAAEMQKLCPLLPILLPVHSETYASRHLRWFPNYSDLTLLKLL